MYALQSQFPRLRPQVLEKALEFSDNSVEQAAEMLRMPGFADEIAANLFPQGQTTAQQHQPQQVRLLERSV